MADRRGIRSAEGDRLGSPRSAPHRFEPAARERDFRGPLLIVVVFGLACTGLLIGSARLVRVPLLGRSRRLRTVAEHVSAHRTREGRRSASIAGVYLFLCWTTRAVGSALLLSALGFAFSPATALCVICLSAAA